MSEKSGQCMEIKLLEDILQAEYINSLAGQNETGMSAKAIREKLFPNRHPIR
jgi:hypothetical protein